MSKKIDKKKKIKIPIGLIIIILIIGIVIGINQIKKQDNENQNQIQNKVTENKEDEIKEKYVQLLEDGSKLNISEKLRENKKIDGLVLKDIQLTCKNGVTTLLTNVENTSKEKSKQKVVEVTLVDENKEKIYTLQGIIEEIEASGTKQLNCSITADFANAYDFTIKEK